MSSHMIRGVKIVIPDDLRGSKEELINILENDTRLDAIQPNGAVIHDSPNCRSIRIMPTSPNSAPLYVPWFMIWGEMD